MFKHRLNGASRDRVNRASSACVACPDGSPLDRERRYIVQDLGYEIILKFNYVGFDGQSLGYCGFSGIAVSFVKFLVTFLNF